MNSDLSTTLAVSAAGLKAQSYRMRVIAENLANAESTASTPDGLPYRRQVVSFADTMDETLGADMVKVDSVKRDPTEFPRRYLPGHPSAGPDGYVLFPNVNSLIETMDMRAAQRSYEANLNVVETSRMMLARTIDLLRA